MAEKKEANWDLLDPLKTATELIFGKVAGEPARFLNRVREAREVLLSPLNTRIAPTPYDVV